MGEATIEPGDTREAAVEGGGSVTPDDVPERRDGVPERRDDAPEPRSRLPRREVLAILVAAALLVIAAAGTAVSTLGYRTRYDQDGRVLPHVVTTLRVAGNEQLVDVGGLTSEEAEAKLADAFTGFNDGVIAIALPDRTALISNRSIGRGVDVHAMVAAAQAVGRRGTWGETLLQTVASMIDQVTIEPAITLDSTLLTAEIDRVRREVTLAPEDASVGSDGSSFVVRSGTDGRTIDTQATLWAVDSALGASPAAPVVTASAAYVAIPPLVTNGDANRAAADAAAMASADVALSYGDASMTLPGTTIASWLRFGWSDDDGIVISVDRGAVEASLGPIAKAVSRTATSAVFLRDRRGNPVGVIAGSDGQTLDGPATAALIADALETRIDRSPLDPVRVADVTASVAVTHPALTTEEATKTAPVMVLVGQWTTNYVVSAHNGYGANITVPIRLINGQTVKPGATFSFWNAVGPVTYANGYRLGGAIINGHSVEGTTLGGGICSASTTVFNAAVRAGYPIVERWNHYYYISRYPLGLDATVYGSASGGQNMRFRNDTPNTLLFRTSWGYGWVHVEIWTVPNGRTATFSKPVVKNVIKAVDTTVYTSSLPKGTQVRLEWPSNGMDVWVTRTVTDASGAVIRRDTFFSHYAKMDGILQIGTG